MFALVDCNSFFASCEQVFRPRLAGRPVVVLSNNDGIVVARSPEAKKLGIPMGEAFFKIKRLVERNAVHVFSSNYELYADMSRRVMQTLEQWTPEIEVYSIDEAFLDVRSPDYSEWARIVIRTVLRWTGIPVSVGIAPTKTLAKVANETAKSLGCGHCVIQSEADRLEMLDRFDIGDVWGVGRRLAGPLRRLGLRTALDLSRVDPLWMRRQYSVTQEMLVRELRGERCFEMDSQPQAKRSIQVSRSFGETTSDFEVLRQAVSTFAVKAAEKARRQNGVASAVYVHVNTSPFRKDKEEYYSSGTVRKFSVPTAATPEILEHVRDALSEIFVPLRNYKKAGVILLDLLDAEAVRSQGFLFEKDEKRDETRRRTERELMESVDRINRRFGSGTVFFGVEGVDAAWKPHRDHRSPCFTTRLEDFPVAR